MGRNCLVLLIAGLACSLGLGTQGNEKNTLMDAAMVYEAALQEVIRQAEPSIACILVSRSDAYKKIFQDEPPADNPGKLGSFDADRAESFLPRPPMGRRGFRPEFNKAQEELKKYNLAEATTVPESYGSGVVIDGQELLVLTNYHVVRDATKIYVRLPGGRGSYANIHAGDPRSDLAVLSLIDKSISPLKAIKLGDAENLQKGSFVVSLANPFAAGFRDGSPSASKGIVSNLYRQAIAGPTEYVEPSTKGKPLFRVGTLIQTDTLLNRGCSGGALLNLKGEMIGLTTARAAVAGSDSAGGFAMPINSAMKRIIDKLRAGVEVEYGFLGVKTQIDKRTGQLVISPIDGVVAGSPAARAGLQSGEHIASINGVPVKDSDDLYMLIATLLAGTTARIEIADRPPRTVSVTLAKSFVPGKMIVSNRPAAVRGMRVDYTSILQNQIEAGPVFPRGNHGGIQSGVCVCELHSGSKAADKLRLNDIITHVRSKRGLMPVNTPAEFYREAEEISATQPLELIVLHSEQPVIIP